MKRQRLKIFILILISLSLFLLAGKKAKSCGPELTPDDYYSIMDNSVFNIPDLKPFFLSEYVFADQSDGTEESVNDNLKDWLKFLKGVPTIDHIEKVVYRSNPEDLEKINQYLNKKDPSLLPEEFRDNSFINYLGSVRSKDIIDYLMFAKKCEPLVSNDNSWDEKEKNTSMMNDLAEQGIEKYSSAHSSFIKDRYAYQVIRLTHYSGQYKKAADLYDRYFAENKEMSLIQYWSLAHKAGAIRQLGQVAEANITFVRIFDKCRSRRRQSILSSILGTDSIFAATYKLCTNNSDRVLLYTLAAIKNPNRSLEFMNSAFRLDLKSEYPELLLSREIARLERRILPTKANWNGQRAYVEETAGGSNDLFDVVSKLAETNEAGKPYLWNFAAGYIATLLNRTEDAKPFYYKAKKQCPIDDLSYLRRIEVAEFVSKVNALKNINSKTEIELGPDINRLHSMALEGKYSAKDALIYIMNTIARLYYKQGDVLKMNLCLGINIDEKSYYRGYYDTEHTNPFGYDIRKDYHKEPIDEITRLISSKYKFEDWYKKNSEYTKRYNEFERFLIDNFMYSTSELSYIQAKSFISRGMFDKALEKLDRSGSYSNSSTYSFDDGTEKLQADPFLIHIRDCHDCDYNALNINRYSLLGFCRRMVELEKLAKEDTANASEYYFLLANGLYNKSYYGNSWIASAFIRTSSPWGYYDGFNKDFYDCSQAEQYYLKAMNLSKSREFAAKCLYMASKCELNKYYNTPAGNNETDNYEPGNNEQRSVPLEFRTHFKKLKNEYSDTQYYKEILKECKFFSNFVSR